MPSTPGRAAINSSSDAPGATCTTSAAAAICAVRSSSSSAAMQIVGRVTGLPADYGERPMMSCEQWFRITISPSGPYSKVTRLLSST